MTSGQKIALSLLTAFLLIGAFAISFNSFLFKEIELKFYTRAKIQENVEQLNNISESYNLYIKNVLNKIESDEDSFTKSGSMASLYVQNPSDKDIGERKRLTEKLFNEVPALEGIRLIDNNGRNVYFSTYDNYDDKNTEYGKDVLKRSGISKNYKNYPDIIKDSDEIPYEVLKKNINENSNSIMYDGERNRIIISVPYFWSGDYTANFFFYFNLRNIEKVLLRQNAINIGQNIQILSDESLNGCFVVDVPYRLRNEFKLPLLTYFNADAKNVNEFQTPEKLLEKEDGSFYVALASTVNNGQKILGIYTSDLFEISSEIKILVYICVFISLFLILFLVFSLKRDPVVVLKNKIKRIQYGIIKEYIDNKEKLQWDAVLDQLKNRKNDLSKEILKSVNVHGKKSKKELDDFLEKNWDEIFTVIGEKAEETKSISTVNSANDGELLKEIRNVLKQVLKEVQSDGIVVRKPEEIKGESRPVRERVEAGGVDDVEELDDVEEIEEAEEVLDDVEDVDDVEELDDVEDVEEAEEVLDDVEDVEELEEADPDAEVGHIAASQGPLMWDEDFFKSFCGAFNYEYKPSNDTFFASDSFPTVDNLFAEELTLGCYTDVPSNSGESFIIEKFPMETFNEGQDSSISENNEDTEEIIEELTEIPEGEDLGQKNNQHFTMTGFGDSITEDPPELEAASENEAIMLKDGVFCITDNLDTTNVHQNQDFKSLVDSITGK